MLNDHKSNRLVYKVDKISVRGVLAKKRANYDVCLTNSSNSPLAYQALQYILSVRLFVCVSVYLSFLNDVYAYLNKLAFFAIFMAKEPTVGIIH